MASLPNSSEDAGGSAPASSERSERLPGRPDGLSAAGGTTPTLPEPEAATQVSVSHPLRDAWVELLSRYPMQWFCTLTFADPVHPERAFKTFRKWVNELNRSLYGKRWQERGQGVYWVLAWEYQVRGVLHFHALIGDTEALNNRARRLTWMDRWSELVGFARIEEIKDRVAVDHYVTKYVVKGGQIDVSESLTSFAQQQPLSNPRR